MENETSLIEQNREIIDNIEFLVEAFRVQNYDLGMRVAAEVIQSITRLYEMSEDRIDGNEFLLILENLMKAQEDKNYVLLADLYELQMGRYLSILQESWIGQCGGVPKKKESDYEAGLLLLQSDNPEVKNLKEREKASESSEKFVVEYSASGYATMAKKQYYYHSNRNPREEGRKQAEYWYEEGKESYMLCGFGLGYAALALAELDETIRIEVYEADWEVIELALWYGVGKQCLEKKNIRLIFDSNYARLTAAVKKNRTAVFGIHYPSLHFVSNEDVKKCLENYFLQYSAVKNQIRGLNTNFRSNCECKLDSVDVLKENWKGKTVYLVAAGPSLDKNFEQLRKLPPKSILLVVGTVFHKLMKAGITPDYVIISDASNRVGKQIEGLENAEVPLLLLSTAYYGFARTYQGKKYMICQKNYEPAEIYAKEHACHLYATGGSVITVALDVGLQLGACQVVFVGLDLAYTEDYAHAADTSLRMVSDVGEERKVEDITGKQIRTGKNLDMYRKWIEKRIAKEKDVIFIDATEGGAKIRGTRIMSLQAAKEEQK